MTLSLDSPRLPDSGDAQGEPFPPPAGCDSPDLNPTLPEHLSAQFTRRLEAARAASQTGEGPAKLSPLQEAEAVLRALVDPRLVPSQLAWAKELATQGKLRSDPELLNELGLDVAFCREVGVTHARDEANICLMVRAYLEGSYRVEPDDRAAEWTNALDLKMKAVGANPLGRSLLISQITQKRAAPFDQYTSLHRRYKRDYFDLLTLLQGKT